jgi:hypothetical protein
MTQVLNAFMAGRQFRNDAQDRDAAQQERQNAQGLANTQGKVQNALMSGDRAGAQQLAQGSGNADIMGQFQQQVSQMDDRQRTEAQTRLRATAGLGMQLLQVPQEQRQGWLQQRAPMLQDMGIDPAQLNQFGLDDQNIRGFIGTVRALDEDVFSSLVSPETLGASDSRYDPLTGQQTVGLAGQDARNETGRHNRVSEANSATTAGASMLSAQTQAAAEARQSQGGGQEWTTLSPQEAVAAGYNEGDVIQRNNRTGQEVRRSSDRIGSYNIGQTNAAGFAARMRQAGEILNALEDPESGFDPASFTRELGPFSGQNQRSYRQAQENWVSANLRRESGAAIPESELANEIRKYFPQPGDGPDVIAQRRAARTLAERAMIQGSQGAYEDLVGSAPATQPGQNAGQQNAPQNGQTATNPSTGERIVFRNGQWEPM